MSLSIQLDRFGLGSSNFNASEMLPVHKKEIEESLAKIFHRHLLSPLKQFFSVRLEFKPDQPTLYVDNQKISLPQDSEVQKIRRVYNYYQNTGRLPKMAGSKEEQAESNEVAKQGVQRVNEASVPGTNGNVLAGVRIADDSLSLIRNVMFALPAFGPNDPIASHLGYYAGIFLGVFALRELDEGFVERKRSEEIGDKEGKERAHLRIVSGSIVAVSSFSYLAGKICDSFALSNIASPLLGASNFLFGAGTLLALGANLFGIARCNRFHERLNQYLEHATLSEKEKTLGAIRFLKDAISVTAEERIDLQAHIEKEFPHWTEDQKKALLHQRIVDLTEAKVKYLKRRTSNQSIRLILDKADGILEKLQDPSRESEGIRDAFMMIATVQKANRLKRALFILGLLAALLSLSAMVISSILVGNMCAYFLYGIAGTIYLTTSVYQIASSRLSKIS